MATALSTNEVTVLYNDVLYRSAAPSELSFWATELDGGTPTLAQLVNIFVTSSEAQTFVDPVIRLYQAVFDRAPDPSGLGFWVGQEHSGVSFNTIVQAFVASPEFVHDYGASPNPTTFVESLYLNVLGRPADSGGLSYWLGVLGTPTVASEATVLLGFVNSAEFIADTQTNINAWLTAVADSAEAGTTASVVGTATYPGTLSTAQTISVAQANTIYTTDGDTTAVYAILDTPANLAAAGVDPAVNHATSVTATSAVTVAQANAIFTTDGVTNSIYAVLDTAGNLAAAGVDAALSHATSITASTSGTAGNANTLIGIYGSKLQIMSVVDTAVNVQASQAALETNIAGISTITLSDSGQVLVLNLTAGAANLSGLVALLDQLIVGGDSVKLSGAAADMIASEAALTGTAHYAADVSSVGITDPSVSVATADTLVVDFGGKLLPVAVSDSAANVQAAQTTIEANISQISSITLNDSGVSTLTLNLTAGAANLTALVAVINKLADGSDHVTLSGAAADLISAEATITGATHFGTNVTTVTITDASVTAGQADTLVADYGSKLSAVAVSDTASDVQSAQTALETNISQISSITLSDTGHNLTLDLTASSANLTALIALVNKLTIGGDTVTLSGAAADLITSEATITGASHYGADITTVAVNNAPVTVVQVDTLVTDYGSKFAAVAVSDTAANVQAALATIEANLAQISSITLSDSGHTLTLTLSAGATNATTLVALIDKLSDGGDSVTLTGAAADLISAAATLTGAANFGADITSVVITDANVSAASADTLIADYGSKLAAVAVVDTAADVQIAQSTLEANISQITSITLSDSGHTLTLSLTASATNESSLIALLDKLSIGSDNVTLIGAAADLISAAGAITGAANYFEISAVGVTNQPVLAGQAVTLVSDYGSNLESVSVSDSTADVQANLSGLIADVGQISSLNLTDVSAVTLSYTVTGTDGANLVSLLEKLVGNTEVTLALSGTTSALETDYSNGLTFTFLNGLVTGHDLAAVTVTDTVPVLASDVATLLTDFGALLMPVAVSDTAADVQAAQATLEADIASISSITLSDSGHNLVLNLTAGGANLTALVDLVNKLTIGGDTVELSGAAADLIADAATITGASHYNADITTVFATDATVTVAQADTLVADYGSKLDDVAVSDTAAHVQAAQATLEANIAFITSITLSDSGQTLTLNLTSGGANETALIALLDKLSVGGDNVTLSGAAADLIADAATITAAAGYADISTVVVTDATVTVATADTLVTDYDSKLANVAILDTAAHVQAAQTTLETNIGTISTITLSDSGQNLVLNLTAGSANLTALVDLINKLNIGGDTSELSGAAADLLSSAGSITGAAHFGADITTVFVTDATVNADQAVDLVSDYGSKLDAVAVLDTAANVGADQSSLEADISQISSISLIGSGHTLTLDLLSGSSNLSGLVALINKLSIGLDNVTLTGAAADLIASAATITAATNYGADITVVEITDASVSAVQALALVTDYGSKLDDFAVSDSIANAQANFLGLVTDASHFTSLTITGSGTLTYSVSGTDGAGLHTLLGELTPNTNLILALFGTAAELEADDGTGLTGTFLSSLVPSTLEAVTVNATTVGAADVATLVSDFGALLQPLSVTDTASNVGANLGALITNVALITSLTVTGSGTINYTVTGSDGAGLEALLEKTGHNNSVILALSGTTANLESDFSAGLTGSFLSALVTVHEFEAVTITDTSTLISAGALVTLVSDFGSLLQPVAVTDTVAGVESAGITTLIADVSFITSLTLTDASPVTLSYTVTGTDGAGLVSLLDKLTVNTHVTLALSGDTANLESDYGAGLTFTFLNDLLNDNILHAITVTDTASVLASDVGTLVTDFGDLLQPVAVVDTTADVQTNLATLIADVSQVSSVTLTDSSSVILSYTVTGTDGLGLEDLLAKFQPNLHVTLALSGTAAHLESDDGAGLTGTFLSGLVGVDLFAVTVTVIAPVLASDVGTLVGDFGALLQPTVLVMDSTADVQTYLATLIADESQISSVTLTDTSPVTLSYTVTGTDGLGLEDLLEKFVANTHVTLALSGTTTALEDDFSAGLTGTFLSGLVTGLKLHAVTVTDTVPVNAAGFTTLVSDFGTLLANMAVSDTVANVQADLTALIADESQITTLTFTDTSPTTLSYTVTGSDGLGLEDLLAKVQVPSTHITLALSGTTSALESDYTAGLTGTFLSNLVLDNVFYAVTVTDSGPVLASAVATLITDFGALLQPLAVVDSTANVQANMATLLADVSHISSLTLTDTSPVTLTYTVTGTDGAALETLLGKLVANTNVTLALVGTPANFESDDGAGLTGTFLSALVSGHDLAAVTVTAIATVLAADVGPMVTDFGTLVQPMSVSDTAADVAAALGTLITDDAFISSVTLTNGSPATLSYTVTGTDGLGLETLLGKFVDNNHVTLALSGTTANLESDYTAGLTGTFLSGLVGTKFLAVTVTDSQTVGAADFTTLVTDFGTLLGSMAVSDTAADVQTDLGFLIAHASQITSLNLTDTSPATITYALGPTDGAGLKTLLGETTVHTHISLALSGTTAILEDAYGEGLTGAFLSNLITTNVLFGVTVTDTVGVTLSDYNTLVADFGSLFNYSTIITSGGTEVFHNLAINGTIDIGTNETALTVDQLGTAVGDTLTIDFTAAGLTVGTLTEGSATGSDSGTVTINNDEATGTSTITDLVDGATVNATTTLVVTDVAGADTDIVTVTDTALTTINLSGTSGTVTIGDAGLTQNLTITMGSGTDTIYIAAGTDTVHMGTGTDTLNIGSNTLATVTLTGALSTDVYNIGGTGTDVIHGLAAGSTVQDNGGGATTALTLDLATAGGALTVDFGGASDSIGTLTEGGTGAGQHDAATLTIDNGASGTTTITVLADGPTTNLTTTLDVEDTGAGEITDINSISDTALTTLNLSGTSGTVSIGSTTALTQAAVAITMGSGADTVDIDAGTDTVTMGAGVDTLNIDSLGTVILSLTSALSKDVYNIGGTGDITIHGLNVTSTVTDDATSTTTAALTVDQITAGTKFTVDFTGTGDTITSVTEGGSLAGQNDAATVDVNNTATSGTSTIGTLTDGATVNATATLVINDVSGATTDINAIVDTALTAINAGTTSGTVSIGSGTSLTETTLTVNLGGGSDTVYIGNGTDTVHISTGLATVNVDAFGANVANVTLTGTAVDTDVFTVGGTGSDTIHNLAPGSTVTDTAVSTTTALVKLTLDAAGDLTFAFGASATGDTVTNLEEGGLSQTDAAALTIDNAATSGTSTISTLTDNSATISTTTLNILDGGSGSTLTIGALNLFTDLDNINLSSTTGTVNIGTTAGIQPDVIVDMGTGHDTIGFAATNASQSFFNEILNYSGTLDTIELGSTTVLTGAQFGTTETVVNGIDTSDVGNVANFLAHIVGGGTAGVAAVINGLDTWVASVNGAGDLTNVVELVGINATSVSTSAGVAVVHIG